MDSDRYAKLNAAEIVKTVEKLSERIGQRFPDASLRNVCDRLVLIAQHASERSTEIGRPIFWLRVASASLAALIVLSFIALIVVLAPQVNQIAFFDFIQALEAGISELVFIGAAILFLVTFEARVKRRRALAAIHELRSLAHIIDMHQLTKDPERIVFGRTWTDASPHQNMTPFELDRYLDYCGEMLALIGKIAALYVQHFEDDQSVAAVNDVEELTSGLSRKIWQKIMILHTVCGPTLVEEQRNGRSQGDGAPSASNFAQLEHG